MGATVGTIIGIIATFGTTAYLDSEHKEEIAHKTIILTLHNIDASVRNARTMTANLVAMDSLVRRAYSLMPDRLAEMPADSLKMVFPAFASQYILISDQSTSDVFSHSFQVWESFDDVKVIGRIGNCFTEIREVESLFYDLQTQRMQIVEKFYDQKPPEEYPSEADAVKALLGRNDVKLYFERQRVMEQKMTALIDVVSGLNDYNKRALGVSQQALDEVGNLMPKN